ncbi:hypothetical protein VDG1235_2780 [Verrucomicrobiia bacterium DG1235]|nr:hypothetical protein VDG1235_2780 [Verrucomicrobiae bacterium DG1235]
MTDLLDLNLASYKAILAPFVMMTSSATLVWALQNRFSRIVQAIRSLVSEGKRDNIDYTHSLAKQIAWLKQRSHLLRNSIADLYVAMCCFLLSTMLLTLATAADLNIPHLVIGTFLLGLFTIAAALVTALIETSRSYASLKEEVSNRSQAPKSAPSDA